MVPPQDVSPAVVEQKPGLQEKTDEQPATDHEMDHQMQSPTGLAAEPQQLLLQCQVCAGLSVLSSDQIQPGAEIGCGFCGSPSVIIQDTSVPSTMTIDYSYAPPIDLFSGLSLDDGMGIMGIDMMDPSAMRHFDATAQFEDAMLAQQQMQDQMFQPQMQIPQEVQVPQIPQKVAIEAPAPTEGNARGRRRPLPSPGLENEMKRRSWVVSNLREQHEEFMRMLEEEEKVGDGQRSGKEDARQAAQDKLTGGVQNRMLSTMMTLRQMHNDAEGRFADPEEEEMGDADAGNRVGDSSSEDEKQIFATPEQAEQMRRRREELRMDEKEKERAKRWRMSGVGSLGIDRRSVGAVR